MFICSIPYILTPLIPHDKPDGGKAEAGGKSHGHRFDQMEIKKVRPAYRDGFTPPPCCMCDVRRKAKRRKNSAVTWKELNKCCYSLVLVVEDVDLKGARAHQRGLSICR